MSEKKPPAWLTVGADSITVRLKRPVDLNGVKQNQITLRVPTVGDMRAAAKQHKDDKEAQEITLFASLAGCAPADIERLAIADYGRVQEGYFRLIYDDDGSGTEGTGEKAGD